MNSLVSPSRGSMLILAWLAALLTSPLLHAQGTKADYERSHTLRALTRNKVVIPKIEPVWFAQGSKFWYAITKPNQDKEFILVNASQGKRMTAFDHLRLAQSLSKALEKEITPGQLPIDSLEFNETEFKMTFRGPQGAWTCDLTSYEIEKIKPAPSPNPPSAFLDHLRPSRNGGQEIHLTFQNKSDSTLEIIWINTSGNRVPYGNLEPGQSKQQHTFKNHVWLLLNPKTNQGAIVEGPNRDKTFELTNANLKPVKERPERRRPDRRNRGEQTSRPTRSPDQKWEVEIRHHNVVVKKRAGGETNWELQVTRDGSQKDAYTDRVHWAPDSKKFVVWKRKQAQEHLVHFVESSPKDQLQPTLHSFQYLKPGDDIATTKPHLFHVKDQTAVEIPLPDDLYPNPWRMNDFRWRKDSGAFTFLYNQRGHQVLRIVEVGAISGQARALINEQSPTFIDYNGKFYSHHLEDSGETIWMSERDGWNHLYLYDALTGKVKNQITQGPWVVRGVDQVDQEKRQIWFHAGGIHPDQDPYHVHYARINLDGSNLVVLTGADGTHSIKYSPDKQFLLATYSRVDLPPVTELRRVADGTKVCDLETSDLSELLKTGWQIPERFVAKGRDGQTDIFGVIYRPTHFDPEKKYPVIEKIYAGPHSAHVPKSFRPHHSTQTMAELGFILVQIDGMGTSHRSKKFHDVAWKNLRDAGFPDRIRWLKAAAETYPAMDLSKVGIYGGSAGGQNTMAALLWHGDFYKVGVADCGCHDNRMDKIWWNELWMGWPIDKAYEENSNTVNAHRLQGHLLLTVGELDRNVDPASTMQVVNALIKAEKDFDMILVPGAGHGVGDGSSYMRRRRADYFVRHLLGVEPRSR